MHLNGGHLNLGKRPITPMWRVQSHTTPADIDGGCPSRLCTFGWNVDGIGPAQWGPRKALPEAWTFNGASIAYRTDQPVCAVGSCMIEEFVDVRFTVSHTDQSAPWELIMKISQVIVALQPAHAFLGFDRLFAVQLALTKRGVPRPGFRMKQAQTLTVWRHRQERVHQEAMLKIRGVWSQSAGAPLAIEIDEGRILEAKNHGVTTQACNRCRHMG